MATRRELMLVKHGFESSAESADSSYPFDEAAAVESGAVWYDHGYVDPWEPLSRWEQLEAAPTVINPGDRALGPEHIGALNDANQDDPVIHGEDARVWSDIGRHALLRRMEED